MKKVMFIIFFIILSCGVIMGQSPSKLQGPPDTINLKMGEPKSLDEALKRIADYAILNTILPPVINREKLEKQLYGKYYQQVKEYIVKNKIDINQLSAHVQSLLSKKNLSLDELKRELYKDIFKNKSKFSKRNIYLMGSIAGIIIILGVIFFGRKRSLSTDKKS